MTDFPKFNFYTTRAAAKKLGVSITTIQLWVESGVLSAWKTVGGHRRIPTEEVDAILANQQSTTSNTAMHTASVLVVEGELAQRELYRIKFAEWGLPINLYLAKDGFEALLMIGKYLPDLIITDLAMPAMDGFEMIRRLTDNKEIHFPKMIVITAFTEQEIESRGGLPENIPTYTKPMHLSVLKPIVEKMLSDTQPKKLLASKAV